MENKTAALLVLAVVASLVVTATAAYAMGRQTVTSGSTTYNSGYGYGISQTMMGGHGYGGYGGGMMGAWNGPSSMYQYMQQRSWYCWNASVIP